MSLNSGKNQSPAPEAKPEVLGNSQQEIGPIILRKTTKLLEQAMTLEEAQSADAGEILPTYEQHQDKIRKIPTLQKDLKDLQRSNPPPPAQMSKKPSTPAPTAVVSPNTISDAEITRLYCLLEGLPTCMCSMQHADQYSPTFCPTGHRRGRLLS